MVVGCLLLVLLLIVACRLSFVILCYIVVCVAVIVRVLGLAINVIVLALVLVVVVVAAAAPAVAVAVVVVLVLVVVVLVVVGCESLVVLLALRTIEHDAYLRKWCWRSLCPNHASQRFTRITFCICENLRIPSPQKQHAIGTGSRGSS